METSEGKKIETTVMLLEGLDCANCALKIEKGIKKIDGVNDASIDFVTGRLLIESSSYQAIAISEKAKRTIKNIEPDVIIKDRARIKMKRQHSVESHSRTVLHSPDHEHSHSHGFEKKQQEWLKLGLCGVLFGSAILLEFSQPLELLLYLAAYLFSGGEVLKRAAVNILRGQLFDENSLMTIATLGAFLIGEYPEGVAVMLFYQVGELFQGIAVNKSRKSIANLMDIRPNSAHVKRGTEVKTVSPEEVAIGDQILVKAGEKIPLDGKVLDGQALVDTSALTGEAVPKEVEKGHEVFGGTINTSGLLVIEVERSFEESTVSKIMEMVENASSRKAPTEQFITKFARIYTPFVVGIAVLLAVIPPLLFESALFSEWIYRALVFLVISCPCALVISIPLGFFGGIGGASKNGILIKGGNYLEALNDVQTVVFDKTGTLTKGVFKVVSVEPAAGFSSEEVLKSAAFAESHSNHPIARSIMEAYNKEVPEQSAETFEEIFGLGLKVKKDGKVLVAGNAKLMVKEKIDFVSNEAPGTLIYLAVDGKFAGSIVIADEVKEDSAKLIKDLKARGKETVMLTGDSKKTGQSVAQTLGIDEVYSELLPDQKVEQIEALYKQKTAEGKIMFVGDGINDAPVLARSDIGVAMGGLGSDAAIEAADVVLMTDEPGKLISAIEIAEKTRRIVWQNIALALTVKGIVLILGAGGVATMWEAVFADVGVSLIAIVNAVRGLNVNGL